MGLALVIIIVVAATQIPLQRKMRARREQRDPSLLNMSRSERYRAGWAPERFSPTAWSLFGVLGLFLLALLIVALTRSGDTAGQRATYAVGVALALGYTAASFVQGWRASRR
jgi:Flp pilus assembly protein TadB